MTDDAPDARSEPGARIVRRPFPREVLAADTLTAARALLGARLVRDALPGLAGRRVGRIVEAEAYVGLDDRASHARMGPTDRNRVMFGPPGIAYVYLVYGMHHCLNVVTDAFGYPAALLVRAVEPMEGVDDMRVARKAAIGRRRSPDARERALRSIPDARLAAGPGLVAAAFGIDRSHTGLDLCDPASPLRLELRQPDEPAFDVVTTPRIGIASAGEPWRSAQWRFVVAGSPSLSRRA